MLHIIVIRRNSFILLIHWSIWWMETKRGITKEIVEQTSIAWERQSGKRVTEWVRERFISCTSYIPLHDMIIDEVSNYVWQTENNNITLISCFGNNVWNSACCGWGRNVIACDKANHTEANYTVHKCTTSV